MNQEIKVILCEKNEIDYMCFEIGEQTIDVNLNDVEGQQDLKILFSMILNLLESKDITLKLEIEEGYKKGLYKEVCSEYIEDLNREIKQARQEIKKLQVTN